MRSSTRTLLLLGWMAAASVLGIGIARADTRPFNATIQVDESVAPNAPTIHEYCPVFNPPTSLGFRGDIKGTGTATRLGKVTATSVDCIFPTGATSFHAFSTSFVMTSANGDTLTAFYMADLNVSPETGVGALTGTFIITGGTGAYRNASGGGTLTGVEVIQFSGVTGTGQGRVVLNGILTTVGNQNQQ